MFKGKKYTQKKSLLKAFKLPITPVNINYIYTAISKDIMNNEKLRKFLRHKHEN